MNLRQYLRCKSSKQFSDILLEFFRVFFVGQLSALEFDVQGWMGNVVPELGPFL